MNPTEIRFLEGTWKWLDSESLAYGRMVGGRLRLVYRFAGQPRMTGQIFDWRKEGNELVARFQWVDGSLSGFVRLQAVSTNRMEGGWWETPQDAPHPLSDQGTPPARMVRSVWVRQLQTEPVPEWAERLFEQN